MYHVISKTAAWVLSGCFLLVFTGIAFAQNAVSPEIFLMRGVFDVFKKGDISILELQRLAKDKRARDQVWQLLIMHGTEESVDVLWQEYERKGDGQVLEYLSGSVAGVYGERYRRLLLKITEKSGRRKDSFNMEVNALIVLGLHGDEEAKPQLERVAADYSLQLLSETAERSLNWMQKKYYHCEKEIEGTMRQQEVKRVLHRFFGPQATFSSLVFNDAGDKVFLNFSCRGEGYNALLCYGPRGWYIAGIWFRYIV